MNDTDVERTSVSGFKFTKCFDLFKFDLFDLFKFTKCFDLIVVKLIVRDPSAVRRHYIFLLEPPIPLPSDG
jgi:flagellar assembly factor FliW